MMNAAFLFVVLLSISSVAFAERTTKLKQRVIRYQNPFSEDLIDVVLSFRLPNETKIEKETIRVYLDYEEEPYTEPYKGIPVFYEKIEDKYYIRVPIIEGENKETTFWIFYLEDKKGIEVTNIQDEKKVFEFIEDFEFSNSLNQWNLESKNIKKYPISDPGYDLFTSIQENELKQSAIISLITTTNSESKIDLIFKKILNIQKTGSYLVKYITSVINCEEESNRCANPIFKVNDKKLENGIETTTILARGQNYLRIGLSIPKNAIGNFEVLFDAIRIAKVPTNSLPEPTITSEMSLEMKIDDGYFVVNSDEQDGPLFDFENLNLPNYLSLIDDDISNPINIGFKFYFFNELVNNIFVHADGYVGFTSENPKIAHGQNLPNINSPNSIIAAWWTDLNPGTGIGSISYELLGIKPNRRFVIQYKSIGHCCGDEDKDPVSFQIKLFEGSNEIEIHYSKLRFNFGFPEEMHSIGIENAFGTRGIQYFRGNGDSNLPKDGKNFAISFRPTFIPNDNQEEGDEDILYSLKNRNQVTGIITTGELDSTSSTSSTSTTSAIESPATTGTASSTTGPSIPSAPTVTSASFSQNALSIIVSFSIATNKAGMTGETNCSNVIQVNQIGSDTNIINNLALGQSPRCYWNSDDRLNIVLGTLPTISFGDKIRVFGMKRKEAQSLETNQIVSIQSPTNEVPTKAIIIGPNIIGSCGILTLSGINSIGGLGRSLKYKWEIDPPLNSNASQQFISNEFVKSQINIPRSSLDNNITYKFKLTVTNFLGFSSNVSWNVISSPSPVPQVTLLTPSPLQISRNSYLVIQVSAYPSICASSNLLNFTWSISPNVPSIIKKYKDLTILPKTLSPGTKYNAILTVTGLDQGSIATVQVEINVIAQVPFARISGGNRLVTSTREITLDASSTIDYDVEDISDLSNLEFSWTCVDSEENPCLNSNGELLNITKFQNQSIVKIPSSTISPGNYIFKVIASKKVNNLLSSESTVNLQVVSNDVLDISINPLLFSKSNPTNRLAIEGSVFGFENSNQFSLIWTIKDIEGTNINLIEYEETSTSLSSQNLVINPNVLIAGKTYIFRLTAQYSGSSIKVGWSEIRILMNTPPQGGIISVLESSGDTLIDTFNVITQNWADDDLPLSYQYFILINGIEQPISSISISPSVKVRIPTYGSAKFRVKCFDKYGAFSIKDTSSNIQINLPSFPDTFFDQFSQDVLEIAKNEGDIVSFALNSLGLSRYVPLDSTNTNSKRDLPNVINSPKREELISGISSILPPFITLDVVNILINSLEEIISNQPSTNISLIGNSVLESIFVSIKRDWQDGSLFDISSSSNTLSILSNIINGQILSSPSIRNNTSTYSNPFNQDLSNGIYSILNHISNIQLNGRVCGESPIILSSPNIFQASKISNPSNLESNSNRFYLDDGSSFIFSKESISSSFSSSTCLNIFISSMSVDLGVTSYSSSSSSSSPSPSNRDESIDGFRIGSIVSIHVSPISSPNSFISNFISGFISITIPIPPQSIDLPISICNFRNNSLQNWKSDSSCILSSSNLTHAICNCTHLSDFTVARSNTIRPPSPSSTSSTPLDNKGNTTLVSAVSAVAAIAVVAGSIGAFTVWRIRTKRRNRVAPALES